MLKSNNPIPAQSDVCRNPQVIQSKLISTKQNTICCLPCKKKKGKKNLHAFKLQIKIKQRGKNKGGTTDKLVGVTREKKERERGGSMVERERGGNASWVKKILKMPINLMSHVVTNR